MVMARIRGWTSSTGLNGSALMLASAGLLMYDLSQFLLSSFLLSILVSLIYSFVGRGKEGNVDEGF